MISEYTKPDGQKLLELARKSIESKFIAIKPETPEGKQFKQARGVFVTLTEKGELRGCVGFPYPTMSITQAVIEAAQSAAFEDSRFPALKEDEVAKTKIEISILTQPSPVKNTREIEIGKDGLICEYMGYSGLLLPQVAIEHKLSRIEFIEALCSKAGLPKNTWQNKNFKIYKFQAQIFEE